METGHVLLIVLGALLLFVIGAYNQFVSLRNRAKNAYANIDVMLKKRFDLIPQLVETVKGYMHHEQTLFAEITSLRNQLQHSNLDENESVEMNNALSQHIGKIFIAVEAYPDLKASTNFLQLQKSIAEIEEQLSASRRSFNMSATQYNTLLEKFPSNLIGQSFGFKRKTLFQATASEKVLHDVAAAFHKN
jgi:LemA protein